MGKNLVYNKTSLQKTDFTSPLALGYIKVPLYAAVISRYTVWYIPWIMLKISIFNFRPRLPRKVLNQQRKRKQVGQLKRNPRKKSLKKRYKHFYYA